jgi:predicted small secreted protein
MKPWIAVIAAALVALASCNTMQGLGQDIQKAGQTLEGAAKKK